MAIQKLTATTLAGFVDAVADIRKRWSEPEWVEPWFRGQRQAEWPLLPGPLRVPEDDFVLATEDEFRDEFQRRGSQLIAGKQPVDKWEWYFTMQHYGSPTRLLDWTDGALLALYFAIGRSDGSADAAVWVLDPFWLNRHFHNNDSIFLPHWDAADAFLREIYTGGHRFPDMPAAIDPPHLSHRFGAQRSHFTIHGNKPFDLSTVCEELADPRLVKITIAAQGIRIMKKDLRTCGIVETTIFPDLEGLSRELTAAYATEWLED
jgi:hypothetical protein